MDFMDRRIAVTGANGGIGRGVVRHLVERGATVYALDLTAPDLDGPSVVPLACDVSEPASVRDAVVAAYASSPTVIDLVNCAGIVEDNVAAEDMTIELFDRVMGVNLRGVFVTCQAFGREMLARGGGCIVNVASMSGNAVVNAPQRQSVYNTSKAGVSALGRSLAVEWGPRGVRVNTVSPGYVDTPLNHLKRDMYHLWREGTVLDRFATTEEVAASIAFLLSDAAGYYCGAELLMDGGSSLR